MYFHHLLGKPAKPAEKPAAPPAPPSKQAAASAKRAAKEKFQAGTESCRGKKKAKK